TGACTAAIASGVRRLTFSRAVVPLEMRFVLTIKASAPPAELGLLEKGPARFFKRRRSNHQRCRRIRRLGVIHALNCRSERRIFRLRIGDVHRGPNFHQRVKLWRGFAMQPNTSMRTRVRMHKALVKPICWREFTPISHRITDIASRSTPGGGDNAIALHAKSIGAGTLLFLLCVNREISPRRWLVWDAN